MSKIFYDHLLLIDELFVEIDTLNLPQNQKQEVRLLVDEILHQRVLTHILDLLPRPYHEEFLKRFHRAPADVRHLTFIQELVEVDVHSELALLGEKIKNELRQELKKHSPKR